MPRNAEMNETYRKISLVVEVNTSIKYLRTGLGELQKITGANDFYHPPLLFLANGLERLFKTMLCLNYQERTGELPTFKKLIGNKNGHDLEYLKSEVEKIVIPVERPFAFMDYELITGDELVNRICRTLSEFGKRGRYFNLDAVLGTDQDFDCQKEWERIESFVMEKHFGKQTYHEHLMNPQKLDFLYETSNNILVSKLESFFRALTRQFIFGNFSSNSKQFIFEIEPFTDIEDEQLGKTNYNDFNIEQRIKRK
ncbi:hypothetical protein N6H18_10020 [Reichenbachiella agarivorans]|uniref:Uncharacterized protein n=1 Tax=Reichenbachiella agarivorans TaxID=2979464 RepID=A0ABY6CQW2_9BACT|nr:hypothetical protein [Reichenbachiella agarivorans]UXP30690.1 hypothetical protein N6H18_10020 [Reichenbachiella agarivorans]